ncbi:MAG: SCO1664 family protein [Actinomycetota bacterium]|nr:SCO1664 family protein [Actinomycetota bacterium]
MPQDERSPTADDLTDLARHGAALSVADRLTVLCCGDVEVLGRMPWSSNATFLVVCRLGSDVVPAIYKPERGERPLWDFPTGIHRREVAAYELSELLGLGIVPETVTRIDAPMGVGSLQRFVPANFSEHYFTVLEDPTKHDRLRALAAFDVVSNNADRKGGHVLLDVDGSIWAIDNGLSFHEEPKLRTVIWEFAGDPVPETLVEAIQALANLPDPAGSEADNEAASTGAIDGSRSDPGSSTGNRPGDRTGTGPASADRGAASGGATAASDGASETAGGTHRTPPSRRRSALADLLEPAEHRAMRRRARRLLAKGRLPHPDQRYHQYPWPLV